jgi:hypothetical protein
MLRVLFDFVVGQPGDRRDVSYKIAQSAEGATQPSPDREVGVQVGMVGSPEGRDTN